MDTHPKTDGFNWGDENKDENDASPWGKLKPQQLVQAVLKKFYEKKPEAPAAGVIPMSELPIPKCFSAPEAKRFFDRHHRDPSMNCAVFITEINFPELRKFFGAIGSMCYIDANTPVRGFRRGIDTVEPVMIITVYLFNRSIKALLSSLGKYCAAFLGGCPFTFVNSMQMLCAPDVCMAFGFAPINVRVDETVGRPEPFHVMDMSNLGPSQEYLERTNADSTFIVVCRIGADTWKYFPVGEIAKTSIYSLNPGAPKHLVIATDDFEQLKTALALFRRIVGAGAFKQLPHFDDLKREGQFVVGGFTELLSLKLYESVKTATAAAAAAAPQVPAAMADFPALPVQDEKKLHDYTLEFKHLLTELKRYNPAKSAEIESESKKSPDSSFQETWCAKMRRYIEKMKAASASLE